MEFKTIETFDNAADLLREHYTGAVSEDVLFYLEHVDEYETLAFLVVNSETVVIFDTLSGYAYHQQPIAEFMQDAIEEAKEDL